LEVAPVEGDLDRIVLWTQVLTRMELDNNDQVRKLDEAAWQDRRQRLEELTKSSPVSNCIVSAAKDHLYWLREEAKECESAEQWQAAIGHLDRVIAAEPRWQDYDRRGRAYARLGQYEKAAQNHLEARKRGGVDRGDDLSHWVNRSQQLLAAGDIKEFRRLSAYLIGRFGKTADSTIARVVVNTCILVPDAVPDWQHVVRLAEQAYAETKDDSCLQLVVGSLYRAGQFEQALERLKSAKSENYRTLDYRDLFRAMAHARLGHAEEARKWLDKSKPFIDYMENVTPIQHRWALPLVREAEALIKGGAK